MNQLTMKYANNKEEITKELRHFFDVLQDHDAMFGSIGRLFNCAEDAYGLLGKLYSKNEEAYTVLLYTYERLTAPRTTRIPQKIFTERFLRYGFDACMNTLELFIAFEHMNRIDNIGSIGNVVINIDINKEKEEL